VHEHLAIQPLILHLYGIFGTVEIGRRVDSFPASWTAQHDYALAALRDRRRLVYEVRKIMALDFLLDCSKRKRISAQTELTTDKLEEQPTAIGVYPRVFAQQEEPGLISVYRRRPRLNCR
jgi:hypothetical protein